MSITTLLLCGIGINSLGFTLTRHPFIAGLLLLTQTLWLTLIMGITTLHTWLSYILFLVFLGGMMILFLYVASLANNEIVIDSPSKFLILFLFSSGFFFYWTSNQILPNNNPLPQIDSLDSSPGERLQWFYMFPISNITLFLVCYLLLALLIVAKIIDLDQGPLRSTSKIS